MHGPCPSVLSRCPNAVLAAGVYFCMAVAEVAPRHTLRCVEFLLVDLVHRRGYVAHWLGGPVVAVEGTCHGH